MATNPIEPIQPVNLPSAAGVNYGEGDVRHFSQGDDVSVPGISNPTRQLAERDNRVAEKLNEVIQSVNNQEQFVPLPIVRTIVPPADETTVLNYRIPAGFESRILNAAVSSSPVSTDVELDIYYNAGFGGTTGTAVVSTSSEFTSGVNFYQEGEFIVSLKNKGGFTLEIVASILLTLRPLGSAGSLLVGSVITGPPGLPGQQGIPGPKGEPGSSAGPGSGFQYSGSYSAATDYVKDQVVQFDLGGPGVQVSSFVCVTPNGPSSTVDSPQGYAVPGNPWAPLAIGATGAAGASVTYNGSYSAATNYAVNQVVQFDIGGPGVQVSTFICTAANGPATTVESPQGYLVSGGTPWAPVAIGAPASSLVFTGNTVSVKATLTAGTPFIGDAIAYGVAASYSSMPLKNPGDTMSLPCRETYFGVTTGSPKQITYLTTSVRAVFSGWGTLVLPQTGGGAKADYTNTEVALMVAQNGTARPDWVVTNGTIVPEVISYRHPTLADRYVIAVLSPVPVPVIATLAGAQIVL